MQRITTFLWFDKQAEEAAKFYCSVFKNSKILGITRHLEGSGVGKGEVLTVQFRLGELIADKNRKKAQRAFDAMLQMRKLDIRKLKAAYDG